MKLERKVSLGWVVRPLKKLKSINFSALFLTLAVTMTSCAVTPEAKLKQAEIMVARTPFDNAPTVYDKLEKQGKIDSDTHKKWLQSWNAQYWAREAERDRESARAEEEKRKIAAARKRWWDSLRPEERFAILMASMQQQQAEQQAQQQAAMMRQMQMMQRPDPVEIFLRQSAQMFKEMK